MANSLWIVLLAGLFQSCGYGFGTPALQSQCLRILGTERSGVATGTYYTFVDIGYGIGPVIGGYIASGFGYGIMCFVTSIFLLSVFALFLLWDRRNNTARSI